MGMDILILNTAVADFRSEQFSFTDALAGAGGLAGCKTIDMPAYTQRQYQQWIDEGLATAGGPGNTAPLIAKAGLKVAVGANLGKGDFGGLDTQGRFFHDVMTTNNVDMSATFIHPDLPTGTTFIHEKGDDERGGIVYFPNANHDFNFEYFRGEIERLKPKIVYYMYSGLSDRGDARNGKDLATFIAWCQKRGIVTIVDSHTLTGNPEELINTDTSVEKYKLLEPLLPQLDIFFTSYDEARMIENTLGEKGVSKNMTEDEYICHFLEFLAGKFWKDNNRTRMFGVTVSNGAYQIHITAEGNISKPAKTVSRFSVGDVVDLVGAGDSFRAGFISYVAENMAKFQTGTIDYSSAIQMGNLFASLYIKARLNDRYGHITLYEKMLKIVQNKTTYKCFTELIAEL